MYITGYHGTTNSAASDIIKNGYIPSEGEEHWLGKGIYFYPNFEDAYYWENSEVVLHSIIKVNDNEYFDWDSSEGVTLYRKMVNYISAKFPNRFKNNSIKNQCAFMQMIWDTNPSFSVMSCTFAAEPTKIRLLIDMRRRRTEFCVRDNSSIKLTQLIGKDDLDD